jgi:tRNA U54 and U55 pseudouridine synthase Pus10
MTNAELLTELKSKLTTKFDELYHAKCNDPAHDDRWCSTCEDRQDAIDECEQEVNKILKELEAK